MKKIFIACTIKEGEKLASFVDVWNVGNNLLCLHDRYKNLICAHLCESRNQADELVKNWNEQYKKNGNYLYN